MVDHPGTPFPHYGEQQAAKRRMGRFTRAFLWFTFLLYAIPISSWVVFDQIADHRLQTVLQEFPETELKDLAPPRVDSLTNGAFLYEAAFRLLEDLPLEVDVYDAVDLRLRDLLDRREALSALERYGEAFDLVRRARLKSQCRFDRKYSDGLQTKGPPHDAFRRMAHALSLRAQSQALEGNPIESMETIRDLWALCDSLADEPLWMSHALRLGLCENAAWATASCSNVARSESDWRQWRNLVPDPATLQSSLVLVLRGELAGWIADVRSGYPVAAWLKERDRGWADRAEARVLKPFWNLGAAQSLKSFQAGILEGERCDYRSRREFTRERFLSCSYAPQGIDLVECQLPNVLGMFRGLTRTQSVLAVTRAGLECERTWAELGSYPEVMQEMDPSSGGALEFALDRSSLFSAGAKNYPYPQYEGLLWNLLHVGD